MHTVCSRARRFCMINSAVTATFCVSDNLIRSQTKQSTIASYRNTSQQHFDCRTTSSSSVRRIGHLPLVWPAVRCRRRCPFTGLLVYAAVQRRRPLDPLVLSDVANPGSRHCGSNCAHTLQSPELLCGAKHAERLRQKGAWRMVRSSKQTLDPPKRNRILAKAGFIRRLF